MAVILLIRHGENDYVQKQRIAGRLAGVHLNENGRKQAQVLADRLEKSPIKAVYSSPLDRTVETAQPIAEAHGLEVLKRPGLIEVDFGTWQNKTLKQLRQRKLWRVVQNKPSMMRFPAGESFPEVQVRISQELEAIARSHKPDDLVACVTHADIIRLAAAHYLGMPMDLFQRIVIEPASITTIMIHEAKTRVINLNLPVSLTAPEPPHKKKHKG